MLAGKPIVVTGAGRGLGREYALAIAAAGGRLIINDVDAEPLDEVVTQIRAAGGTVVPHLGSIADWNTARDLVDRCVAEFGAIEGLLNNAGLTHTGPAVETTESDVRKLLEVNVMGTIFCGTHAMKLMSEQGRGTIVNVTSRVELGATNVSIYAATKGAISSLSYCWSLEMAPHNVRVNVISPIAQTRMFDSSYTPAGLAAVPEPAKIAPLAVYLLSDEVPVSGQVFRLDGPNLNMMTHADFPSETAVTRPEWSAEEIAQEVGSNPHFGSNVTGAAYH